MCVPVWLKPATTMTLWLLSQRAPAAERAPHASAPPARRRHSEPRARLCRAPQRRHRRAQALGDEQREATVAGQRPRRERREHGRPLPPSRERAGAVARDGAARHPRRREPPGLAAPRRAPPDAQRGGVRGGGGASGAERVQCERVAVYRGAVGEGAPRGTQRQRAPSQQQACLEELLECASGVQCSSPPARERQREHRA